MVAALEDLFRANPAHHVRQVMRPEAFPGAHRGGEHLLRRDAHVLPHHLSRAHVAAPAVPGMVFVEVSQEQGAAARRGLHVAQDLAQPVLRPFPFFRGFHPGDVPPDGRNVARSVQQEGVRILPVPCRAAGFLVVAFHAAGQVPVHHPPHVRLVDAHAERDGGHHHRHIVPYECFLPRPPVRIFQARVVGHRGDPAGGKEGSGALHRLSGAAVHDPRLAGAGRHERKDLALAVSLLRPDAVEDLFAVEARPHHEGGAEAQQAHHVLLDLAGGRGGEGGDGHAGELGAQEAEGPVVRSELVTPLGDAVGLVHCQERQAELAQRAPEVGKGKPLRGDVQELHAAAGEVPPRAARLLRGKGAVQHDGGNAVLPGGVHLVLHQGNQGAHDHGETLPQQGGQLVAQRLAAAGGESGKDVPAGQDLPKDIFLVRAKGGEAESALELSCQVGGRQHSLRSMHALSVPWEYHGASPCHARAVMLYSRYGTSPMSATDREQARQAAERRAAGRI